jgi:hypothetical protein
MFTYPSFSKTALNSSDPASTTGPTRICQDMDEVFELYSVPLAGGNPVKLNASLVTRIYLPVVLENWLGTSCQQGDGHAER